MTVTHKLFKILSGHDVANGQTYGRTDGQTDRHTDGRTRYHNTSEVSLRAYKNEFVKNIWPKIVNNRHSHLTRLSFLHEL